MNRNDDIQALLTNIENTHGVTILYAVESGSRAWGFASTDSDYDIRFIYCHPEGNYLKITQEADTIEIPIVDDLDAGGWDVKKALSLLRKSNGPLVEWLYSPIVYRADNAFLQTWRDALAQVFSPYAQLTHYRGLARKMWQGSLLAEQVRAKSYLYCLRATACACWVERELSIPPVAFHEVKAALPSTLATEIDQLLRAKSTSAEKDPGKRYPAIDQFLADEHERSNLLPDLPKPPESAPVLDHLFRSTIKRGNLPLNKCEYTLERVRQRDLLLFETIAGSKAFGTDVAGSDEDIRGIFAASTAFLTGLDHIHQVQDDKGDQVYFELGRVIELLTSNNPNLMELLAMPDDCIRFRHPVMDFLKPELFLSKRCEQSFGGYALGQIQKARGLNKKIMNPEPEQRKSLVDFCHVLEGQGSIPLAEWCAMNQLEMSTCGMSAINHAPGIHALYCEVGEHYRGIFSPKDPDKIICSSVPKGAQPKAFVMVNDDAFQSHCKNHAAYWRWVSLRNEQRYLTNYQHDKGYDTKNMMHTLRLLDMSEEIAKEHMIRVRRPNRDFLLRVRAGHFSYEEIMEMAEEKMERIKDAYHASDLPDEVDANCAQELLIKMRASLLR